MHGDARLEADQPGHAELKLDWQRVAGGHAAHLPEQYAGPVPLVSSRRWTG
ncbi:hypothetical protein ACFWMJ_35175 [Streptomyces hawaiiensis]|uniref:hypothetical protein n=1 Tax=Streptomyces hawaiiensis TaxID=67305 RepID=UPI003666F69B